MFDVFIKVMLCLLSLILLAFCGVVGAFVGLLFHTSLPLFICFWAVSAVGIGALCGILGFVLCTIFESPYEKTWAITTATLAFVCISAMPMLTALGVI